MCKTNNGRLDELLQVIQCAKCSTYGDFIKLSNHQNLPVDGFEFSQSEHIPRAVFYSTAMS